MNKEQFQRQTTSASRHNSKLINKSKKLQKRKGHQRIDINFV